MVTADFRDRDVDLSRWTVRAVMWFLAEAGGLSSAAGMVLATWHLLVV